MSSELENARQNVNVNSTGSSASLRFAQDDSKRVRKKPGGK